MEEEEKDDRTGVRVGETRRILGVWLGIGGVVVESITIK